MKENISRRQNPRQNLAKGQANKQPPLRRDQPRNHGSLPPGGYSPRRPAESRPAMASGRQPLPQIGHRPAASSISPGTSRRDFSPTGSKPHSADPRRRTSSPAHFRKLPSRMNSRGRKKHHGSKRLYYLMFTVIAAIVVVILAHTVLFNLSSIETESLYPKNAVIEASGLQAGMNLLYIDTEAAKEKILTALPDADEVNVRKVFPSKAVITVTQALPAVRIAFGEGSYLVSEKGRIIDVDKQGYAAASLPNITASSVAASPPGLSFALRMEQLKALSDSELPQSAVVQKITGSDGAQKTILSVVGFEPKDAALGDFLESENPDKYDLLFRLIDAIEENGLSNAGIIDLSDVLDIKIRCGNFIVEIGGVSDLDVKLSAAQKILSDGIKTGGTLNISNATEGVFTPR